MHMYTYMNTHIYIYKDELKHDEVGVITPFNVQAQKVLYI